MNVIFTKYYLFISDYSRAFAVCFIEGKGSSPPLQKGLHRNIRQVDKYKPLKMPNFSNANLE